MTDNVRDPLLEELNRAAQAVAQLFTAAGKEMTELEVRLWLRAISGLGYAKTMAFVEFWMEGGGQGRRAAPTVEDFRKRFDETYVCAGQALELLREEVARKGPYGAPAFEDARLRAAVLVLGGWPKVCQDMPDPAQEFAHRRYAERFVLAWSKAEGMALRGELCGIAPLSGLTHSSQLSLGCHSPAVDAQPVVES